MTWQPIHSDTRLGPVYLTVTDLDLSQQFYTRFLGLKQLERVGDTVFLGVEASTPLVALKGRPDAKPRPPNTTGLYHYAILLPNRVALALSLKHLLETRYSLQGASDHLVSEAIYLADPDDNGIEIYRDRPRDEWPRVNGQLQMSTEPLDINNLLAELKQEPRAWDGLPPETKIGHIHLHVPDLDKAEAFYRHVLGFEYMTEYGSSALFLSAGGYHHHIGLNTWAGLGAPPPPPNTVGLRYFTINLPNTGELKKIVEQLGAAGIEFEDRDGAVVLHDPFGHGIILLTDSNPDIYEELLTGL